MPIKTEGIAKERLPYDDREGCLFTVTVHREEVKGSVKPAEVADEGSLKSSGKKVGDAKMTGKTTGKMTGKTPEAVLLLLTENPALSIPELSVEVKKSERAIERAVQKLREEGRIRRIGPAKGGHWEVIK